MGLFNGYLKEGKGIDKNAPKKRGLFLYFETVWQKMGKLVAANCLYTLTSLIWIVALYFFFGYVLVSTGLAGSITKSISRAMPDAASAEIMGNAMVTLQIFFAMAVFVLWGSGPGSSAYAYVSRCFTRSEPVWVASDGWDKLKENFKQSMVVLLIDAVILLFGINAIHFYYGLYQSSHSFAGLLISYIMLVVFVIYTMMHSYIYQIMVTFECSIKNIYKNALLLALAKLPGNIFTTFVSGGVLFLIFAVINLNPLFAAMIAAVFGLCFTRFVTDFYAARVIEKTVLKNMKSKQAAAPAIEYLEGEDAAE